MPIDLISDRNILNLEPLPSFIHSLSFCGLNVKQGVKQRLSVNNNIFKSLYGIASVLMLDLHFKFYDFYTDVFQVYN